MLTTYDLDYIFVDADMGGKRSLELLKYRQKAE